MHATELTIGNHIYLLPAGMDDSDLLGQLTQAVRAGGGVVEMPSPSASPARFVLISPGVPVFIEHIDTPIDAPASDDSDVTEPVFDDW